MIVMKFGGTSVKDADAFRRVKDIIISKKNKKPVVVLSATAGTTDNLLNACKEAYAQNIKSAEDIIDEIFLKHTTIVYTLIKDQQLIENTEHILKEHTLQLKQLINGIYLLEELSDKTIAKALSYGEQFSTLIFSKYLEAESICNKLCDARAFIITKGYYKRGEPVMEKISQLAKALIAPVLEETDIAVTQGFIARNEEGEPSLLGRGGSDYTASILGSVLKAEVIEIWTDVDGILTADPRKVNSAQIINEISFLEASELAFFGAKVLHPATIIPAIEAQIPVYIFNSYKPEVKGTRITSDISKSNQPFKAITSKSGIVLLNIYSPKMLMAYGFLKKVFDIFDKYKTSVDLISTSEVNISLTIDNPEHLEEITSELSEFSQVNIQKDKSLICLVGQAINNTKGIVKEVFDTLGEHTVYMISQGASSVNISFVVTASEADEIVNSLHSKFFEK